MTNKQKIKIAVDLVMTITLLLLMLFQITGQQVHEYLGIMMLCLFLEHGIVIYLKESISFIVLFKQF